MKDIVKETRDPGVMIALSIAVFLETSGPGVLLALSQLGMMGMMDFFLMTNR